MGIVPIMDSATASFLSWEQEYRGYERRAGKARASLRELRRLHRHHLPVSEAYIYLHCGACSALRALPN